MKPLLTIGPSNSVVVACISFLFVVPNQAYSTIQYTQTESPGVPFITLQPSSQIVRAGSTVALTVAVGGDQPLNYQWLKNGLEMPGSNSMKLTLTSVQPEDVADYSVRISNAAGETLSTEARVNLQTEFLSVQQQAVGEIELLVAGEAGRRYQLQTSMDLENWSPRTNYLNATGVKTLTDSSSDTARFCRILRV